VTYTPAPIQSGFLTQFTTNYSKYALFQKTCIVQQKITITGSGGAVAGNNILVNLPFSVASFPNATGSFYYLDSGLANYGGPFISANTANYGYMILPNAGVVGANPNIIVQVNDTIQFTISYEVA